MHLIRHSFDRFYKTPLHQGTMNPNIHNIRITTVHGILSCLATYNQFRTPTESANLKALLKKVRRTENQQQIVDAINSHTQAGYIDLSLFSPPASTTTSAAETTTSTNANTTAAATSSTSAPVYTTPPYAPTTLGGRHTRKQRKALKKKTKKYTRR